MNACFPGCRTIMAYNCPNGGCTRINFWSNPDMIHTPSGQAMGIPLSAPNPVNNVLFINQNAARMAQFRQTAATGTTVPWTGPSTTTTTTTTVTTTSRIRCPAAAPISNGVALTDGPGAYLDNTACVWTITAPAGFVVRFVFSMIDLESGYDLVRLYDGPSISSPLITTLSGNTIPSAPPTSTGNVATLRFTTDSSVVMQGFDVQAQFVPVTTTAAAATTTAAVTTTTTRASTTAAAATTTQATTTTTRAVTTVATTTPSPATTTPTQSLCPAAVANPYGLTITDGPNAYLDNTDCAWTVTAPAGYVVRFVFTQLDVEDGFDYVDLLNGPSVSSPLFAFFTGTYVAPFPQRTSPSNTATLHFTTDESDTRPGFSVQAQYVCAASRSLTVAGTIAEAPGTYPPDLSCAWTYTAPTGRRVRITFSQLGLGTGDTVTLRDGSSSTSPVLTTYSGTPALPTVTSTGRSLRVQFASNSDASLGVGFTASTTFV
jgi:hypothetical protein